MYDIKRAGRKNGPVLQQNKIGDLEYLSFPMLDDTGLVKNLFSTRLGGVSEGIFGSLNLGFGRGEDDQNVLENFRRVGDILGTTPENMVRSSQTHTTNIKIVTDSERGNGIVRPNEENDIDGLITKEKGLVLVTSYADCVPLYFVDPVNEVIGLAHSGWRGTAGRIGKRMVELMHAHFGTRPEDIVAAIGPSICQECYEVSEDVADVFLTMESELQEALDIIRQSGVYDSAKNDYAKSCFAENNSTWNASDKCIPPDKIVTSGNAPVKYQLDLWLANAAILIDAGICPEKISITDICTCHNPEYLFSHRASQGKRGGLCAFLMLKES